MIKKILLGAFCIAQFSTVSAYESENKDVHPVEKSIFQKVPKTIIVKTKKFKIKIDVQPNGKYLYQSWAANSKITSKPSMIISDGEIVQDGSGGNYYYEFNNNGYLYQIWRNYLTSSKNKSPYTLVVINDAGDTIVKQDAQIVKN
ncbi:hypothetical protein N0B16_06230 [Chryseobacterium sp. GMJ5]|uniref:Bulb-type lectin domain-containing protein n=1 Tax=Chryseobacterium gilvum TaxID=2976534 RepID=A0ABT2VY64_9FLAO|nr:hypothetical protein [Chryseobacterium gilvum]MCU7614029.1 hypothetical protein [Chryseobacterium gilvum]